VRPIACLGEIEHRPARDHFAPMPDEGLEHFFERQQPRLAIDEGHHVDAEHRLERRLRKQIIEHDFGVFAAPQLDDDAHAVLVGLIPQTIVGDAFDLFFAYQIGDALDQSRLVHLIRQLGDDDRLSISLADIFEVGTRTDREPPAPAFVRADDFLGAIDDAGGRKIRPRHMLHETG
jgi:hypothetical protein